MKSQVEKVTSLLDMESNDVRSIGIWGMGGIGKTEIANVLHQRYRHQFEADCFLGDVGKLHQKNGLTWLQKVFICKLLGEKLTLTSEHEGLNILKKVLFVLDDVNHQEQLEFLVGGTEWFGKGSRIVLTARNKHLLISHVGDNVYEVQLLSEDEALELFSKHAFIEKSPKDDFMELSKQVVNHAGGLPLALKHWKRIIDRLKRIPHKDILGKLRLSFDGLDKDEKELFLDIYNYIPEYSSFEYPFICCAYILFETLWHSSDNKEGKNPNDYYMLEVPEVYREEELCWGIRLEYEKEAMSDSKKFSTEAWNNEKKVKSSLYNKISKNIMTFSFFFAFFGLRVKLCHRDTRRTFVSHLYNAFPEINGDMHCLTQLTLNSTGIREMPSFTGNMSSLTELNLPGCEDLVSLPDSLCNLMNLQCLLLRAQTCDFHLRGCFLISFSGVRIPELLDYNRFINQKEMSILFGYVTVRKYSLKYNNIPLYMSFKDPFICCLYIPFETLWNGSGNKEGKNPNDYYKLEVSHMYQTEKEVCWGIRLEYEKEVTDIGHPKKKGSSE
ncbi:hypothetical protein H5410_063612 [Solanum commersonii]|uniref:ADP-ribosyl cyclase/cyclic ADP-ribose hydrolase n=1 Tax=Solanum commersonii TaxID=4109 RepID=A0A9J5WG71_SOLCO|nr:hypothetical protein H5410_063612 [Solanum commersonii]